MNNGKTLKSAEAPKEPEEEKNELSEEELDSVSGGGRKLQERPVPKPLKP